MFPDAVKITQTNMDYDLGRCVWNGLKESLDA